ncbi:MAG: hypothetical protein IKJ55_01160 [Clostridia bacterium]|nr:hypothetical protein [Clostridia bacterium]
MKRIFNAVLLFVLALALFSGCASDSTVEQQNQKAVSPFENCEIGAYITFGTYEQDNNTDNGKEDIEWLVLDKKDGKALVISKYALDCKPYSQEETNVTWETCDLRNWLNNDFLHSAFSSEEKEMISTVTVPAHKNPDYTVDAGNNTKDKVFLLSIDEAENLFVSDEDRKCEPTAFALAGNVYEYEGNCWYWLRTSGFSSNCAAYVHRHGAIDKTGYTVTYTNAAVRPAMWISIE